MTSYTIQGNFGGSVIKLKAGDIFASAIWFGTWGGQQLVDDSGDGYGRLNQSAIFFDQGATKLNPTEAGAQSDAPNGPSSSNVLSISASGTVLHARTQMADFNGSGLTSAIVEKTVTVGAFGIANAIQYDLSFEIPDWASHTYITIEALCWYLPTKFNRCFFYEPATQTLTEEVPLKTDGNGEGQQKPVIWTTQDLQFAVGVWAQDVNAGSGGSAVIGRRRFTGAKVSKWNYVHYVSAPTTGNYAYQAFAVVGTLAQCQAAMDALYAHFNP